MRAGRGANPRPNLDAAAGRSPGRPLPGTATTRKEPIGHTGVAPWMHPGGGFVRLFLPAVMTGSIERERWRTCRVHDGETLKALSSPWSRSTQLATERSFTCAFPRKRQASPSPGRHRCPCHPQWSRGRGSRRSRRLCIREAVRAHVMLSGADRAPLSSGTSATLCSGHPERSLERRQPSRAAPVKRT